ncbi:cytochrome b/b6 domain-containing protein [bacterium]|nr:cytochrome b/b6 domain-containing protein [bacterium]MBU1433787.1 cytochrome b/b6 domain-containing protein [bacterium]MBU1503862.1 cytochrome b/b6 domain-containing protein [bacterium]
MTKIYVWSLFTRLFHILLVLAVGAVFLLAEVESLLSFHAAVGFTIGVLFVYRIIWGFMDVKYSKFKDFNFNLLDLKEYMFSIFADKKEYVGHNPASSWAIVAMIVLGLGAVFTGMVVYGTQEGMGVFSFLNISLFKDMDLFEDIHEFFANAFMAVIFIHIAGVILDKVLHKSKAVESMIDGCKNGDTESLKLTLVQKLFGIVWIGSSVFLLIYLLANPSNVLIADANTAVDYKKEHPAFSKECISCHTLYPPYLLPKESWVKMMGELENHFGDDASLDAEATNSIREYLVKNSAESSTKESAFKILNSMDSNETIAITKTPYWKKRHREIDESVFKSKKVASAANCKACHTKVEQGLLNDKEIKIPQG